MLEGKMEELRIPDVPLAKLDDDSNENSQNEWFVHFRQHLSSPSFFISACVRLFLHLERVVAVRALLRSLELESPL